MIVLSLKSYCSSVTLLVLGIIHKLRHAVFALLVTPPPPHFLHQTGGLGRHTFTLRGRQLIKRTTYHTISRHTRRVVVVTHVTSKSVIFGDILLIVTGKPNKLQKIHNHLEKEDILSFLQMVVDIL